MPGLKLKLPVSFTDTDLPILRADPILGAGTLLVWEAQSAIAPLTALPADGATLKNVAEKESLALLGSSVAADVSPVMRKPAAFTGTAGKFELTAKGGLHGISPQGGNAVAGSGPVIELPAKIMQYLLAHAGATDPHDFYMSVWGNYTRKTLATKSSQWFGINGNGQQSNSNLLRIGSTNTGTFQLRPPNGTPYVVGNNGTTGDALGPKLVAVAGKGWSTNLSGTYSHDLPQSPSINTAAGTAAGGGVSWGSSTTVTGYGANGGVVTNATWNDGTLAANKDYHDSHVIYRVTLIDLTAQGMTYEEVFAIDSELYNKRVLTAGGRYYGDTFTDPATIA